MTVTSLCNKDKFQDFQNLLEPIYNSLYKYIYSIVRRNYIAEDVIQETIYIAMRSFDGLRDISKFKSWIFTIGKNEAIKNIKRYKTEIYPSNSIMELFTVAEDEPFKVILKEEEKKEIINAINSLKKNYKDVIILRYYAELTLDEISVLLNKNYNTIRSLHKRAKQILFQELQNTYWSDNCLK